jgi:hypothetical protein
VKLLRILQTIVAPDALPIDLVRNGEIGGRGGWASGFPARLPTRNADGAKITSYCILDRDYFPDDEIAERYGEAQQRGVNLHVWRRKELENFLLVPDAISRFIGLRTADGVLPPDPNAVASEIDRIVSAMHDSPILDSLATNIYNRDKRGGLPKANKAAREILGARWKTREGRWGAAPGKEIISKLSGWSQSNFGVSFGPEQIARTLEPSEVDAEVVEVLQAITSGRKFRSRRAGRLQTVPS